MRQFTIIGNCQSDCILQFLLHRPERKMRQNKEISHYIFFILKNI